MHTSIKLKTPVEFINITPLNPLISKCQIKVCYVGDEPNRNKSIITKETAKKMANSLPGCPIVGYYNKENEDFEEHNRIIEISNGQFKMKDTTRPYGFVDLNAKVWFQKFLDDGEVEREYMMTEGWLWTGQYPECSRVIEKMNNQSMELDEKTINAYWSKDNNGNRQFFIINEALISKLCILGEENEPCFEGSQISAPVIQFAFDEGFKEQIFSMMNELKEYLNMGGKRMFNRYSIEIGSPVWEALYNHTCENYTIESVCEDDNGTFAVLKADEKFYRLNFAGADTDAILFSSDIELLENYVPEEEPQFSAEAIAEYVKSKKASQEDEDKDNKEDKENDKEEKCPKCGKPKSLCECEDEDEDEKEAKEKDKKQKYNLDNIQEYVELSNNYSALQSNYNDIQNQFAQIQSEKAQLESTIAELNSQIAELTTFKKGIEKAEKKKMIDSFYMLSDSDKQDVVENIDNYSIDDIEAKLSILCVRNKVNFNLDNNKNDTASAPITFNLNDGASDDVPAWVKAIRSVASNM